MATKRRTPSGKWEFCIRKKSIVGDKPKYFTFDTEEEGDRYIAQLYAAADKGIAPEELFTTTVQYANIAALIKGYMQRNSISAQDTAKLKQLYATIGMTPLTKITYPWCEKFVADMKQFENIAPNTIRHRVGALRRCCDWAGRINITALMNNPLKLLPRNYAQYNDHDVAMAQANDPDFCLRVDIERDRRPTEKERENIRKVIRSGKSIDGKSRVEIEHQAAFELMTDLAVETAMRMRELYTLSLDQIRLQERTVFLEKTKNGHKRQVPLSSVAVARISEYMELVKKGEGGMAGFKHPDIGNAPLFPWWDGSSTQNEYLRRLTALMSQRFGRIHACAGCPDLTFHDYRHEATCRLFERTTMRDTEIMTITGHSSIRMLKRYANLRASHLAEKMW